jgi:hypothetical protein
MLRDDRWRRAWVFLVPVALYGAWWLWSLGLDSSSESQIALGDALLFPSWVFQSMSGILGALAGLDYSFNGENQAGPTLAVLALVGVGWRFSRGRVPKMVWASLAIALALWFMETISTGEIRTPDTPRYLYSGALVVLIAGSWVAAGVGWRRPALVALFLLAASGVATNVAELRGTGGFNRAEALQQQAVLGGFEVAGANADPSYVPELGPGPIRYWAGHDVGDYLEAAARYESIGYSPAQLRGLAEPLRELADQGLVGALGLKLTPAAEKASGRRCVDLGTDPGGTSSFELASGQALDLESDQQATVAVGRFADSPNVSVGILQPGQAMTLAVPADTTPDPWVVSSSAPTRACIAR